MSQVKKGLLGALGKADMKLCKARYILLHRAGNSVNSLKDSGILNYTEQHEKSKFVRKI